MTPGRAFLHRMVLAVAAPVLGLAGPGQAAAVQDAALRPLPLTAPGFEGAYQPADDLERSLWQEMAEYERTLRTSQQVIRDPALNDYVREVLCRTVGPECQQVRLYILRAPEFNATMAPNGVMTVWSGLLLRVQNEAQLAAVLGHEYSHFQRRHSLAQFRRTKKSTNSSYWLSQITGAIVPFGGLLTGFATMASLYDFSRDQEEEADLDGLGMMAAAGYDPAEAPLIWERLLAERDATLEARGRKVEKRKTKAGLFDTHPSSQGRIEYMQAEIARAQLTGGADEGARYRAAMAAWWPQFLDDQLKLNDPGGSLFVIDSIEQAGGWSPWIAYARAEFHRRRSAAGDIDAAIGHYSDAIARGGDLPELWRGRGYALRKAGRAEEAVADLREYLGRAPDAHDRAMVSALAGGQ
jgi:Zn-dependent protease with chaperone function